jgi:hypothetical protein
MSFSNLSVPKKPSFFGFAKNRIKVMWGGKNKQIEPPMVLHPEKIYKSLEGQRKRSIDPDIRKKHSKSRNIGKAVRLRLLSGPELNIIFLGVPIIIDLAVTTGQHAKKRKRIKKRNKLLTDVRSGLKQMTGIGDADGTVLRPVREHARHVH